MLQTVLNPMLGENHPLPTNTACSKASARFLPIPSFLSRSTRSFCSIFRTISSDLICPMKGRVIGQLLCRLFALTLNLYSAPAPTREWCGCIPRLRPEKCPSPYRWARFVWLECRHPCCRPSRPSRRSHSQRPQLPQTRSLPFAGCLLAWASKNYRRALTRQRPRQLKELLY